jgi:hypothetical protein
VKEAIDERTKQINSTASKAKDGYAFALGWIGSVLVEYGAVNGCFPLSG